MKLAIMNLVLKGLNHPGRMDLKPGLNQIGRNPTNDFRVLDATVSSFHCELVVTDQAVAVRDLCTTNGTFIGDRQIEEDTIRPGQVLRLGNAEFLLEDADLRVSIPDLTPPPPRPLPPLPAGAIPCCKHPGLIGTVRCRDCGKVYCDECVKPVRIRGQRVKRYCHSCLGQCESIPGARAQKRKKMSIVGKLTQTIRIWFK